MNFGLNKLANSSGQSRKHKNTSGMDAFGEEAYFLGRHVDAQDAKTNKLLKNLLFPFMAITGVFE